MKKSTEISNVSEREFDEILTAQQSKTRRMMNLHSEVRSLTPARKAVLETYVEMHFPIDKNSGSATPLCTYKEFLASLEGGAVFVDSQHLSDKANELLNDGERKIAKNKFWNLWQKLPSAVAAEVTAQSYRRILETPLSIRLVDYSKESTSAATLLGHERLLEWQAGLGEDKLHEAADLFTFAAGQGDPEASYLLGSTSLARENTTYEDEDSIHLRGVSSPKYLCADREQRADYLQWAAQCGYGPAVRHFDEERDSAWNAEYAQQNLWEQQAEETFNDREEEIDRLRPIAETGDARAQWELGDALLEQAISTLNDLGHESDSERIDDAWRWIEKAAANESCAARLRLASRRSNTPDTTLSLLESAAFPEHGKVYTPALCALAEAYEDRGSIADAERCLRQAIAFKVKSDDVEFQLAKLLLARPKAEDGALREAKDLLLIASQDISLIQSDAALRAGLMLLRGEGGEKDIDKAYDLFGLAAKGHSWDAATEFMASLVLALGWGKAQPEAVAAEKMLRWLDLKKFNPTSDFCLEWEDINLLMEINPKFGEVNSYELQRAAREKFCPDLSRLTPTSCFGWVDNFLGLVGVLFAAIKFPSKELLTVVDQLTSEQSMVENFLLGQLWLNGRLGDKTPELAADYFSTVEQLAKKIEPNLKIGPGSMQPQAFFNWVRDRAINSHLMAKNEMLEGKSAELSLANKDLEKTQAELEDLMGMFAHKFRGPVDSVVFNAEHQLDRQLFINIGRTMTGLLDIFSCVSTSSDILKPKLTNDCIGSVTLSQIVRKSLWLALVQLLPQRKMDLMSPHYFAYAVRTNRIDGNVTFDNWQDEDRYLELQRSLSLAWELEVGATIGSEMGDAVVDWCRQHLFEVRLTGIDESSLRCAPFGAKESVLVIVMTELFVNAIKHFNAERPGALELSWSETDEGAVFMCKNPSNLISRSHGRGSGRGHGFLRLIARNIEATFSPPGTSDESITTIRLPSSLIRCAKS